MTLNITNTVVRQYYCEFASISCYRPEMQRTYILLLLLTTIAFTGAIVKLEISNREPGPIWVGIRGNTGHPHLEEGGINLEQGQSFVVDAPDNWSGQIWPRTWCDPYTKQCETGACRADVKCQGDFGIPPMTVVDITLRGYKGLDYYDISMNDGMNLRAGIEPVNGEGTGDKSSCKTLECLININAQCPEDLRKYYRGQIIACHSMCSKYDTDMFCCKGDHDRPETCNSTTWPNDFPTNFYKKYCPDAYSYNFDPNKETYTCKASHYKIHFGASY